jgi:APA family basic amino acid/polyamine antiporter
LQSAGLLFFAFAGYARIATLGEEVRAPTVTIPRAITRALGLVIALYAVLALLLLATIGADGIAASALPLLTAAQAADVSWAGVFVRVGATVAALGALLGLLSGVGRTVLAMARRGDLPRLLAAVDPGSKVPAVAQLWVAGAVAVLVLLTDLRHAIGFSSFGVLLYYAIANASAWTQTGEHRRWPRWVQAAGLVGCLALAATLPIGSVVVGALVVGVWGVRSGLAAAPGRCPRLSGWFSQLSPER